MLQNSKRWYYQVTTDPALIPVLLFLLLYALGLRLSLPMLWFPALLIALVLAFWQKFCRVGIGQNFQALPALPGGYHTVGQRAPKGAKQQTCPELRRSLIQDSRDAAAGIPAGKYQAVTHEAVLRRLKRNGRICVESAKPIYKGALRPILNTQSHNRCRLCKAP